MKHRYKTVKEVKREVEEEAELVATGIGLLVLLIIYVIGMIIPYFI